MAEQIYQDLDLKNWWNNMLLFILIFSLSITANIIIAKYLSRNYEGGTMLEKFTNFSKTSTWLKISIALLLIALLRQNPITITIWSVNILIWVARWLIGKSIAAEQTP